LLDFIKTAEPTAEGKVYVDTGPVMDKAWAVRAGIGWLGKHTNVITREFGSWVFLGEILLTLELDYDAPIADFCGTCTACIKACPTQAIVQPYLLDSNRCISYLTIELKDKQIPDDLKPQLENWIYGCDICQDVCPWNSFATTTTEPGFQPREENVAPRLDELATMTQEQFSQQFRKSPIKRTKHSGLMRNVKTAMETVMRKGLTLLNESL
jgi:epoxyqueuosine reductase